MMHFVDPSIPGISGRDLINRTVAGLGGLCGRVGGRGARKSFRQDICTRDRHLLRDIGLDEV